MVKPEFSFDGGIRRQQTLLTQLAICENYETEGVKNKLYQDKGHFESFGSRTSRNSTPLYMHCSQRYQFSAYNFNYSCELELKIYPLELKLRINLVN